MIFSHKKVCIYIIKNWNFLYCWLWSWFSRSWKRLGTWKYMTYWELLISAALVNIHILQSLTWHWISSNIRPRKCYSRRAYLTSFLLYFSLSPLFFPFFFLPSFALGEAEPLTFFPPSLFISFRWCVIMVFVACEDKGDGSFRVPPLLQEGIRVSMDGDKGLLLVFVSKRVTHSPWFIFDSFQTHFTLISM